MSGGVSATLPLDRDGNAEFLQLQSLHVNLNVGRNGNSMPQRDALLLDDLFDPAGQLEEIFLRRARFRLDDAQVHLQVKDAVVNLLAQRGLLFAEILDLRLFVVAGCFVLLQFSEFLVNLPKVNAELRDFLAPLLGYLLHRLLVVLNSDVAHIFFLPDGSLLLTLRRKQIISFLQVSRKRVYPQTRRRQAQKMAGR